MSKPEIDLAKLDQSKQAALDTLKALEFDGLGRCLMRLKTNQRLSGEDYGRLTAALEFAVIELLIRKAETEGSEAQ